MSDFLWQSFHRLIAETQADSVRFLYPQLDVDHRLTGIIGPRGVGKTTLMLQFIKNKLYDEGMVFYFSADNTYFNEYSIINFIDELCNRRNIRYFFIDEIHMYANWHQELKNIYDSFPQIKLYFSGSSSVDLLEGSYDLSRRARLLAMPGLSFREYLNIRTGQQFQAISFDELIQKHQQHGAKLSQVGTILQYFEEYLNFGYYPFVFENRDTLYAALSQVIEKTIYEDISNFFNLKTSSLNHFKRILNFLASMPPGKVSTNKIAQKLQIDNKTVDHYLYILQRTGLVKMLYPLAHGNQLLHKAAKVYLDNTTLLSAMNTFLADELNIGTLRELAFLQFIQGAGLQAFHHKQGDFQVHDIVFEVGGRNKTWQQLRDVDEKKVLVKDGILVGHGNEIPLYLFGFLY